MLKKLTKRSKERNGVQHEEFQYLGLVSDILEEGELMNGRNGVTKAVFGSAMHFTLENNVIPILTTKRVAWRTCLRELLWFIKGSTNNEELQKKNVRIWDGNASREFLDSRGLTGLRENDLGPVYGHQWRFFNAPYDTCDTNYAGRGVDQLERIIEALRDPKERYSRRLVMSAWNPCQIDEMALPPCHVLIQFNVLGTNKLSCSLYQRSGDVGLGVPFNIASYSFLTHLIAKHCGLQAVEFCYHLGNSHIYSDHLGSLEIQARRAPYQFPTVDILEKRDNINDYTEEDFVLNNYVCHPIIKMEMRK